MEVRYSDFKKWSKLMTAYSYTYKSNKIKIGVNEMTVNDSEIRARSNNEAWSMPETSVLR